MISNNGMGTIPIGAGRAHPAGRTAQPQPARYRLLVTSNWSNCLAELEQAAGYPRSQLQNGAGCIAG